MSAMERGTVRVWLQARGYGFIAPDAGGEDVFVHVDVLTQGGIGGLATGERVAFQRGRSDRGPRANHVELVE